MANLDKSDRLVKRELNPVFGVFEPINLSGRPPIDWDSIEPRAFRRKGDRVDCPFFTF